MTDSLIVPSNDKPITPNTTSACSNGEPTVVVLTPKVEQNAPSSPRVAKVLPPAKRVDHRQWRQELIKEFHPLCVPAEIAASVIAQLLINDVTNPFALAQVDVPSSGKTTVLDFFKDLPELTYPTDAFTPASFVSNASNVSREDLSKVDLLPRIQHKVLIVRDLAPIFGAKEDDLKKTLGILTRVLDGEGLSTDTGVYGQRGYAGDYLFMLLAATTPIQPRVFKIMSVLGGRMFFLNLNSPAKSDEELIEQNRGETCADKIKRCARVTRALFCTLWSENPRGIKWDRSGDSRECLRIIAKCAKMLAALRGVFPEVPDREENEPGIPDIEKPDRINCLLYNLARGHAVLCGRRTLMPEDLSPVIDVALDSCPSARSQLMRGLIQANGTLLTSQVEVLLKCSKPTALKQMKILTRLGLVVASNKTPTSGHPEQRISLSEDFKWFGSGECRGLLWRKAGTQGGNL